jgi:hypothetical protein
MSKLTKKQVAFKISNGAAIQAKDKDIEKRAAARAAYRMRIFGREPQGFYERGIMADCMSKYNSRV